MSIRTDIFGWFDDHGPLPAHDPGLNVNCLICAKPLTAPVKTISLMKQGDNRSFFYRCHKACYENLPASEISDLESSLIDNI